MGFSSQAGHVIFRTQPTQGTVAPDLGAAGVAMPLRSGSLGVNRELMIPDAEIGGGRDVADAYLATINNSGDYEFYARLCTLVTVATAAFGKCVTVTATGVTTHTITPTDTAQLPYLSIEEKIAANFDTFVYHDAVVNTLHLEAEPGGYLQGTVGIIAARRAVGATPTAVPKWDVTPLVVGTNIVCTYNSVQLPAKSFTFDLNNNIEDTDFRLGSFFLADLTPKRREVTASFSIRESDKAQWRQATLGAAAATVPSGLATKSPCVITCNTYEMIGASSTAGQLVITMPKFAFKPYNLTVSGDDILESTLEGQALRPDPAVAICTLVIKNGTETVA